MHFIMLNNKIFRNNQIQLDKVMKKYGLSSGSMPYLFILEKNEGVSLHQLSRKIGNDKAMTTRTIKRLIELEYVYKVGKDGDCRAYQLYLTEKARAVLPKMHRDIQEIVDLISVDSKSLCEPSSSGPRRNKWKKVMKKINGRFC